MRKDPFQHVAYFLHKLRRLKNYVQFSETSWEKMLANYNRSLKDDDLNLNSFGGRRDHCHFDWAVGAGGVRRT